MDKPVERGIAIGASSQQIALVDRILRAANIKLGE